MSIDDAAIALAYMDAQAGRKSGGAICSPVALGPMPADQWVLCVPNGSAISTVAETYDGENLVGGLHWPFADPKPTIADLKSNLALAKG